MKLLKFGIYAVLATRLMVRIERASKTSENHVWFRIDAVARVASALRAVEKLRRRAEIDTHLSEMVRERLRR